MFAALAFFNSFQISSALAAGIRMGRSKKRKQLPRNVWVTKLNHLETMIECTHDMVPVGRFHCRIAQRHQGFLFSVRWSIFKAPELHDIGVSMAETFTFLHLCLPFDVLLMPICSHPTVVQSCIYIYILLLYPKEMQRIWWVQISWTSRKNLQVSPLTKHVGEAQLCIILSITWRRWLADRLGEASALREAFWWTCRTWLLGWHQDLVRCLEHVGDTHFKRDWLASGSFWDPNRNHTWIYCHALHLIMISDVTLNCSMVDLPYPVGLAFFNVNLRESSRINLSWWLQRPMFY